MKISVRPARSEEDFEFIAQYFEATIALWEDYVVTPASIAKQKEQLQSWGNKDNAHLSIALTPELKHVGFNSLYISKSYDGSPYGKIVILYVLPEFRSQGIAAQLKKEGETWLKSQGVNKVQTEIDAQNQRMLEINQKAGFRIKSYTLEKTLDEG